MKITEMLGLVYEIVCDILMANKRIIGIPGVAFSPLPVTAQKRLIQTVTSL